MADSVTVRADMAQFRALFGRSATVDKKLQALLRANIRVAGETAATAVRVELRRPGGTVAAKPKITTGLRAGIADGIKVGILAGTKEAGVVITATAGGLQADQKTLLWAWQAAGGWRHPVFGKNAWVSQRGNPYFYKPISATRVVVQAAVLEAMREAADSIKI